MLRQNPVDLWLVSLSCDVVPRHVPVKISEMNDHTMDFTRILKLKRFVSDELSHCGLQPELYKNQKIMYHLNKEINKAKLFKIHNIWLFYAFDKTNYNAGGKYSKYTPSFPKKTSNLERTKLMITAFYCNLFSLVFLVWIFSRSSPKLVFDPFTSWKKMISSKLCYCIYF